jgi:ATP-dependent DNA helicase RecG
MTFAELQALIAQGEGTRLDFKRGVPPVKDLALMVVCLANAQGGKLLLGVSDDGRITGCASYNIPDLLSGVYRATDPPITVDIEPVDTPSGTVLAVSVPRTAFVHGTTGGVFQRRVGRECLPMSAADVLAFQSERGGLDFSALPLPEVRFPDDVDPRALELLRAEIAIRSPALAPYSDSDLLRNLRLLTDGDKPDRLTVAAGLLLAKPSVLRRALPQAEVAYVRFRSDVDIALNERLCLPLPLLLQRLEELIQAANDAHTLLVGLQRIDVPAFPVPVYREAILNAISHRNYGLPGNVFVRHYPDRLEVMNPGGLPTGVTPHNILRQVVPRNPLIAEILQRAGYVERAGYGVDLMYRELLRLGKEPPMFAADELSVRVMLRNGEPDEPFVTFVEQRRRAGTPLSIEEMLVLRHLKRNLEIDRDQAMALLEREESETLELLSELVRQRLLERVAIGRPVVYQLTADTGEQLGVSPLGRLLTPEQQKEQVLKYVCERGEITNSECQRLCGLNRDQARYLLQRLVKDGQLVSSGRGRWMTYRLASS